MLYVYYNEKYNKFHYRWKRIADWYSEKPFMYGHVLVDYYIFDKKVMSSKYYDKLITNRYVYGSNKPPRVRLFIKRVLIRIIHKL